MPVHFSILAFRWTFVHLTTRTTGTALAWKTLGVMLKDIRQIYIRLTSLFLLSIIIFVFAGCFNTTRLVKTKPSDPKNFSKSKFDGLYENTAYFDSIKINLWTILSECKSFAPDGTQQTNGSKVRLSFDGNKKLTVALVNNDSIVNKFDLEVSLTDNYLSIKRHLHLIPIPVLYYEHSEVKVVLSNDKSGQLDVKYGILRFLCICLWTAGYHEIYNPNYNKAGT